MTHDELVRRAERWMTNYLRCGVVLTESHAFGEVPDAIGWKNRSSFLIECKVTRGDFISDAKKAWRKQPSSGMGDFRYFLVPDQLIELEELPARWGLLYAYPHIIRIIKAAKKADANMVSERQLLYYNLRRLQLGEAQ